MIYLYILLIAICCVIVVDLTDFVDFIKMKIWNWVFDGNKPYKDFLFKPMDCSLCLTFWTSLLYLIITKSLSIPLFTFILFIAFITPILKDTLLLLKDIMLKLIDIIYKILKIN